MSSSFKADGSSTWTYNGQKDWVNDFPDCALSTQSPINIPMLSSIYDPSLGQVSFDKANLQAAFSGSYSIEDTGYGGKITFPVVPNAMYSGDNGARAWTLSQMHFHDGSEHTIEGHRAAAEAHVIHYDPYYPDLTAAVDSGDPDAIKVIGFMIEVGDEHNSAFPFSDYEAGADFSALLDFFPDTAQHQYNYPGSFTTPPCSQLVDWSVLRDTVYISQEQFDTFSVLYSSTNSSGTTERLYDTFREVQPLNGRQVSRSYEIEGYGSPNFGQGWVGAWVALLVFTSLVAIGAVMYFPKRIAAAQKIRDKLKDEEEKRQVVYQQSTMALLSKKKAALRG
jgi:carbonic anhydrase